MPTEVERTSNAQGENLRQTASFPESIIMSNGNNYQPQALSTAESAKNHRLEAIVKELPIELRANIHGQHFRRTPA